MTLAVIFEDFFKSGGGLQFVARWLHVLSGIVPPHERPAAERVIVANLTRACAAAAEKDIFLMLEPLNQRDRPDYFVSHIEHIADIIAKVGKPNLKIMYDFYHVQVMQGDVLKRMEKHLPLIGHVQFAGPPTRVPPHKGELNFPIIFDAIDAMRAKVSAHECPARR